MPWKYTYLLMISFSFTTLMTVDSRCDVVTSVQFIITPFSPSFTGLIDNMDMTGKTFSAEILE